MNSRNDKKTTEAVDLYARLGSIRRAAVAAGVPASTLWSRILRAGRERNAGSPGMRWTYPQSVPVGLDSGAVLVGGDGHFWPGQNPPAWRAFCEVAKSVKPCVIILNGDMIDGTRISRHGRLRGQHAPRVIDEINAARQRVNELPKAVRKFWTIGNHDARIDSYLANMAPEMDDFAGGLRDRFEDCEFTYSVLVNDDVEVRHRFRGGIHAGYNNVLHSGRTLITNHTHQLGARHHVDRRGSLWGVETGMLNDPAAPQFEYTEDQPRRWTAGFCLLTWRDGVLMPPELAQDVGGEIIFRGKVVAK